MAQESWNCDTADGSGCQQQEGLVLCPNNCGLVGCAATMNLCSKCYRELTLKKQGNSSEMSVISASSPAHLSPKSQFSLPLSSSAEPANAQFATLSSGVVEDSADFMESSTSPRSLPPVSADRDLVADLEPITALLLPDSLKSKDPQPVARKRNTNRCLTCKRRMGLLGFKCRCGNIFCASHRYSDKHGCPFDYKSAGREAIAKANPIVKAQKVERI